MKFKNAYNKENITILEISKCQRSSHISLGQDLLKNETKGCEYMREECKIFQVKVNLIWLGISFREVSRDKDLKLEDEIGEEA